MEDAPAEQLKRDGFVVIPEVLDSTVLKAAREAFGRVAAPFRESWIRGKAAGRGVSDNGEYFASGTFHGRRYFDLDVVELLCADDALVELVAAPRLLPVLQATVGDDVQATTIQARVLPSHSDAIASAEGGYVGWHRDHLMAEDWQHRGMPLNIKVIFYLTDSSVGAGCTYFVPASQRLPDRPPGEEYLGMGGAVGYVSRRPASTYATS